MNVDIPQSLRCPKPHFTGYVYSQHPWDADVVRMQYNDGMPLIFAHLEDEGWIDQPLTKLDLDSEITTWENVSCSREAIQGRIARSHPGLTPESRSVNILKQRSV